MFSFNPELANDGSIDEGDVAFDDYERSDNEDDITFEYKELDLDLLAQGAQEVNTKNIIKKCFFLN